MNWQNTKKVRAMTDLYYAAIALIAGISIVVGLFPVTKVIAENARKNLEVRLVNRSPERIQYWYKIAAQIGVDAVEQMKRSKQLDHIINQAQTITKTEVATALKQRATEAAVRFLKSIGYKNPDEALIGDIIESILNSKKLGQVVDGVLSQNVVDKPHEPTEPNPAGVYDRSEIFTDMEHTVFKSQPASSDDS